MVCDWLRKVSYLTMIGWKMALLFGTMHESKTCRAFISLSHGRNLNHIFLMFFNSCFVLKACPAISDFLLLAKHRTIVSAHKEQTCQGRGWNGFISCLNKTCQKRVLRGRFRRFGLVSEDSNPACYREDYTLFL